MHADRNLLFGLLALQNGLVTRDQLVAAFALWMADKSRSLDSILSGQKALSTEQAELLRALAALHLRQHGDDPQKSLAALSSVASARRQLADLQDADLQQSLAHVSIHHAEPAELETVAAPIGQASVPGGGS